MLKARACRSKATEAENTLQYVELATLLYKKYIDYCKYVTKKAIEHMKDHLCDSRRAVFWFYNDKLLKSGCGNATQTQTNIQTFKQTNEEQNKTNKQKHTITGIKTDRETDRGQDKTP